MAGILFDARWITPGMTGVGNFAHHLLRALPETPEKIGVILPSGSPYAKDFERFDVFFSGVNLTRHPRTELFEQFSVPLLCYRHGFSNFVSFEGRTPLFHPRIKTFSFVYDLSFLRLKGSHNLKYSVLLFAYLMTSRFFATRIVTISKTVRNELAKALKIPLERILVVYPSNSCLDQSPSTPPTKTLRQPYFLAVGMTNRRKNLGNLVKGFSEFNERYPTYQLAITGDAEWITDVCLKLQLSNLVNLGFVDEGELKFLYENATGFIYASLDEGFGIPLLDALQFNCPVICSDIPVFREVMKDCAVYFDPLSSKSIAHGLETALIASRSKSRRVLENFSWEKSGLKLLEGIMNS